MYLSGDRSMPQQKRKRKRKSDKPKVKPSHSLVNGSALTDVSSLDNSNRESPDCIPDNQPPNFTDEEWIKMKEILNQSNSRQNFAWKLCQHFFDVSELRGSNTYGRKGKKPLDANRVKTIQALAFLYFPLTSVEEYPKAWSNCRIAIDKGIRNIAYIGAAKKQANTAAFIINTALSNTPSKIAAPSDAADSNTSNTEKSNTPNSEKSNTEALTTEPSSASLSNTTPSKTSSSAAPVSSNTTSSNTASLNTELSIAIPLNTEWAQWLSDRVLGWGIGGSSVNSVTVLCPWARRINPCLVLI